MFKPLKILLNLIPPIKNYFRVRWIKFLVKDIYNTISEEDILTYRPKIGGRDVFLGGVKLNKEQIQKLKEDARAFRNSEIWRLINNQWKWVAVEKIGNNSETLNDIVAGKLMIQQMKVLNNLLNTIESL